MKYMLILQNDYAGDEIAEIEQDVYQSLDEDFNRDLSSIPTDEHGFMRGTLRVTVEWVGEE